MADGSRLAFVVDYNDPQAGIVRKYQLVYYTADDTLEMHDIKNRRIFLKRSSYPQVAPADLYIGAYVTVHCRRLLVTGYADDATKRVFASQDATTCAIVPPEGYERLGQVLDAATKAGLRIVKMNMLRLTEQEVVELQNIDSSAGQWAGHAILALELAGTNVHEVWQKMIATSEVAGCTWSPSEQETASRVCQWILYDPVRRNRSSAALHNCALLIVKPHAVRAGQGGAILDAVLDEGFEVSALRRVSITQADAEDFLEVYKGVVPEYTGLVEAISAAPMWVAEIRAENAVKELRKIVGPHDPEVAKVLRPNSIRARFGTNRCNNGVHCTDLPEDGLLESDFFFDLVKE